MTDTTLAPAPAEAPAARPDVREIGIIMNGVSGRMGYRQHLVRSILAIRDQGGIELPDGTKVTVKPILVGRSEAKLAELAAKHGIEDYTSDLDAALADPRWEIYADFLVTKARSSALRKAIAAGKTIYTEKPTAETVEEALELAKLAEAAGVKTGVVHDKLYLPGLQKLKRLIDSGFFGRILSVRGEFGYWVFEGDWQPAQRPSWNYRVEDGGGIIVDMFPHWNYVLENLFGKVETVYAQASTHIPTRWDENGEPYAATAEDAAYGIFELEGGAIAQINSSWTVRVNRDELVEFHVDGTHGSAVVGLFGAKIQHRNATPKPVWNPDLADDHDYDADWAELPTNDVFQNGFRQQWEEFLTSYVRGHRVRVRPALGRPRRAAGRGRSRIQPRRPQGRAAHADAGVTPMPLLTLLDPEGATSTAELAEAPAFTKPTEPLRSRVAYAAAHVVPKVWADNTPGQPAEIDWDATLAFRRSVYSWGLGVADAMDTAQRNMGLDAVATRELIARSAEVAREEGGSVVVGVNTDHVEQEWIELDAIIDAYKEQLHFTEEQGAGPVLMASRHLARAAATADDYRRVYREVLGSATAPVVLHWLGTAFDPSLAGYFGSTDWDAASDVLLEIIGEHADKIAGVKMSLLDAAAEVSVRERLPEGVRMFTGDDFNYVGLIGGDTVGQGDGHSDALLGAFAAITPVASAAIQALDAGDPDRYLALLGPTEELSRQVFAAPTFYYKTGVAFLAWLNGHQTAFQMVGGLHSARSLPHLSRIVELANASNALEQPELAAERWHAMLRLNGVDA